MPTMPGTFRSPHLPTRQEMQREHDRKRGSARGRGYNSRWDRESRAFRQANPLCLGCQAVGRVVATAVTDHTMPHRGDERLFWDPDNRQPACQWHHDVVKQRLEALFDAGEITADELRLDSPRAIELTKQLGP